MEANDRTVSIADLASLLSSALGEEKSHEVVTSAARNLGYASGFYTPTEVRTIFNLLSRAEGLIGVVARFALSRGDVDRVVRRSPGTMRRPSVQMEAVRAATSVDLLPLLAPALGTDKARDATTSAAARLKLDPHALSRDHALLVLDELTKNEGIVGVVARFAKARFLLTSS
jgi:hypothetical protein